MKWFSLLAGAVFLSATVVWAGPDEEYIALYQSIEEADQALANGQTTVARNRFAQVQAGLKAFKAKYSGWNERTVDFRLQYVTDKLNKLGGPAETSAKTPGVPTTQAVPPDPMAALRAQVAQLQEERKVLNAKLQEALAAQPAAVDPRELQKAEAQINGLQKEKELMRVALEQEQAKTAKAADKSGLEQAQKEIASLKSQLAATAAAPAATERELANARETARTNAVAVAAMQVALKNMREERDAVLARAAAADRAAAETAIVPTKPTGDLNSQVKQLEKERDDLLKALNATKRELYETQAKTEKGLNEKEGKQLAILRSRLEVLESRKVPFTPEEMALFKPTALAGKTPPTRAESKKKELPAGAGIILTEAQRLFANKQYEAAEAKYREVLKMDEKNVFTLGNLGAIQMEMAKLDDAEATLTEAQGIDPVDGFVLSTLGILRFRQNKFDEAFDLLSRAVELDPKNFEAYNYLGITLSQKGQRSAAETALRKALEINPSYAGAHHNLAVIYATQQPPFIALAKYHYDKALALGHAPNPEVEKLIAAGKN